MVTKLLMGAVSLYSISLVPGVRDSFGRGLRPVGYRCAALQFSSIATGPMARRAALDTQMYRDGYPGKADDLSADLNLQFYMGHKRLPGYRENIDRIHRNWFRDWERLEMAHDFIQWLFPIRETSMFNYDSQELQLHEAKAIRSNPKCMERVRKSYELMLDFYGMKLVNEQTGEVARHEKYRECYDNLDESGHNLLRITRILKCLGELGLEHYKKPFVMHILKEIYENGELTSTEQSCTLYWANLLRDDNERQEVQQYIQAHNKEL